MKNAAFWKFWSKNLVKQFINPLLFVNCQTNITIVDEKLAKNTEK